MQEFWIIKSSWWWFNLFEIKISDVAYIIGFFPQVSKGKTAKSLKLPSRTITQLKCQQFAPEKLPLNPKMKGFFYPTIIIFQGRNVQLRECTCCSNYDLASLDSTVVPSANGATFCSWPCSGRTREDGFFQHIAFRPETVGCVEGNDLMLLHNKSSWWLNHPIWKICSSNGIISPGRDKNQKMFETTNQKCLPFTFLPNRQVLKFHAASSN